VLPTEMEEGRSPGAGLAHPALRDALLRAVSHHCPHWLASHREDLVQSAMVRVLERERREGYEAVRTATYAWKVAYSVVVDEIRRRLRRAERPIESVGEPVATESSESGIVAQERGAALRLCLASLAAPRRVAVMLHLQGHRMDDGAELSGWDVKRYSNLVYRGLADVRRCLTSKGITS
jgi:RNA polymerase sigma-70 factor, ECF subfamily